MKYSRLALLLTCLVVIIAGREILRKTTLKESRAFDTALVLDKIIKEKIDDPQLAYEFLSKKNLDLMVPLFLAKHQKTPNSFSEKLSETYSEIFSSRPPVQHPFIETLLENSHSPVPSEIFEGGSQNKTAVELNQLGFSEEQLDLCAVEYAKVNPNTYICLIAPRGYTLKAKIERVLSIFGEVVYVKPIPLTGNGPRNLLLHTYSYLCDYPHAWVNEENKILTHLQSRFSESAPSLAILFTCPDVEIAKAAKKVLRHYLKLQTTGVHITDSPYESKKLAEVLFHNNTLKALAQATFTPPKNLEKALDAIITTYSEKELETQGLSEEAAEALFEGKDKGNYPLISDPAFANPEEYFLYKGVKIKTR